MPTGFDMDSGLFTEDFTGEIADIVAKNGDYGTEVTVTVALDNPYTKKDGTIGNERLIFLKVTEGFTTSDGVNLVNPDDTKKITRKSKWGAWVQRIVDEFPEAADAILAAGGGTYCLQGYTGLRFHFMTEGAGEKYSFTDKKTGEQKSGEKAGVIMPVEYLGTGANPSSGAVGASAPAAFSITALPDDVIEAWGPLAESTVDNAVFSGAVLKTGLLSPDKLGDAYGPATEALGNGSLREALSLIV